jgi:YD repeat-containing protein
VGQDGLRVTLLGADTTGSVIGRQDVFFGDVGTDMDAVVAPKLSGADLSVVLRSRMSPEQIRYRVTLPTGAMLKAVANGAIVSRADVVLAHIPAPSARDAQGTYVPVEMAVSGDELVLTVAHRGHDLAYPVLVDPEVLVDITKDAEAWNFYVDANGECEGNSIKTTSQGSCEGHEHVFTHSNPGEPLGITMPPISLPYVTGEEDKGFSNGGDAESWWLPEEDEGITSVEFVGITSEGSGSEAKFFWDVRACSKEVWWTSGEAAPSSVRFTPTSKHTCNKLNPLREPVVLEMQGETTKEPEVVLEPELPYYKLRFEGSRTTISGSISASAVLISRPISGEEEREFGPEKYGVTNPGKPKEPRCLLGFPVNCATGNQVLEQIDLSIGGRGPGLALTRTYNSQLAANQPEHGPFGFGWTGPYSAHLKVASRCRGIYCGESVATVTQNNGSTVRFERYADEPWKPIDPLVQATLAGEGTSYVYTLPNQSKLTFNGSGQLTKEAERNGNSITLTYNAEKQLEAATDGAGRKITFKYNGSGEVESVTDSMGHTVKYTYESGNLASVTQPGETKIRWKFKYNAEHELTSETDGREHTVTTEYNTSLQVTSQADALSRKRKWAYAVTETGLETTITEPNGATTVELGWGVAGLLTSVTHASGTALAAMTTYEYNGSGQLIAVTDPNNIRPNTVTTLLVIVRAKRMQTATKPNGHTTASTTSKQKRPLTERPRPSNVTALATRK